MINLTTISHEDCENTYKVRIHESNFCAKASESKSGTCEGDMGGAAVYNNELVGLSNFHNCGEQPDGFVSIAYFYDWIRQTMRSS